MSRKALSKKLRFEVFKRDSFTCQYCGRKAPEVVLQCDHIDPVAKGGQNAILNLITSCVECNAGKCARSLSDQSTLAKQVDQLAELQERREQIEMMLEWRKGLEAIKSDAIDGVAAHWEALTEGNCCVSKTGKDKIRKLLKDFGTDIVFRAMSESLDSYAERNSDDDYTIESVGRAFEKLGGVCRVLRDSEERPWLKRAFYIRGILRNRLSYIDETQYMSLIEQAVDLNVDLDSLQNLARRVKNWSTFRCAIEDYVRSRKAEQQS